MTASAGNRATTQLVALALLLSLTACGSSKAPGGGAAVAQAECNASVTVQNVSFYGTGQLTTGSACPNVAPPVTTLMNAPYAITPGTGLITYGSAPYVWGTFKTQSSGQVEPTLSLSPNSGAMTLAGRVTDPADGGFAFISAGLVFADSHCVNVSQYQGVSFDVAGDLDGCSLHLGVASAEDSSTVNGDRDQCTAATCSLPSATIEEMGAVKVPFASLSGGAPQPMLDPTALIDVLWTIAF